MKKNMIRVLALVLVLILALCLIPLGALAAQVDIYEGYSEKTSPKREDVSYLPGLSGFAEPVGSVNVGSSPVTIKTSNYNSLVELGGKLYDLKGLGIYSEYQEGKEIKTYSSITIGAYDGSAAWNTKWGSGIDLIYTAHQHRLTGWATDPTNHWRNCTVCKEEFIAINWHYDKDLDDFCDVCGSEIYYYDITENDCEGGKITVKEDSARYRDKIYAEVEAEEGYVLHKVHFYKVRPNGTRSELTRYTRKRGQTYYFEMPSFEVEVEAEFFKK